MGGLGVVFDGGVACCSEDAQPRIRLNQSTKTKAKVTREEGFTIGYPHKFHLKVLRRW
jgi:hypothetical protein